MEQIYTIPVNEAFDANTDGTSCTCPFCALYDRLQRDEIDIILGASMMEPDIRIKTNEQGFCRDHYKIMLTKNRKLGMGLILESHLNEVEKRLKGKGLPIANMDVKDAISSLSELEGSCYVCGRINKNLTAMIHTAAYLWGSDTAFREKLLRQPYFCLPHYRALVEYASKKMDKRIFRDFYKDIKGVEENYIKTLENDVSWFCKKFDYRYDEEPWYNSKDSVQRSIKFLSGTTENE